MAAPVRVPTLMTALIAACVAFQLNASMFSPALVTMARELSTTEATIGLTQTAFFTSAALFGIFVPRLGDIVGRKRTLQVTLVAVLAGSVVGAVAVGIPMIYAGRILQGISGGVIALCLLMLRTAVTEPRKYGTLMGVIAAVNGGIAGVDALVGGVLVANLGFRSIFWTIAVVAVLAIGIVGVWAPESRPSEGMKMDWLGVLPLLACMAALQIGLTEAGKLGAANWALVAVLAVVAVVAFVAFLAAERSSDHPLVRPDQLKQRGTWAILLTTTLTLAGVFAVANGLVIGVAQSETAGFGLSADVASVLLLTPYALVGWLVGPFAGRLAPRFGYLRLLRIGLVGCMVSIAVIAGLGVHSLAALITGTVLLGVTYAGIANIMLNGLAVLLSPPDRPGFLPGINSGAFNFGAGLSFAMLPVVQVLLSPPGSSSPVGYGWAMALGLVIVAGALAASYLIPRPRGAEVGDQETAAAAA